MSIGNLGNYAGQYGFYVLLDYTQLPAITNGVNAALVFDVVVNGDTITWYCTTDNSTTHLSSIPIDLLPGGCVHPRA